MRRHILAIFNAATFALAIHALASDASAQTAPQFPLNPEQWINSGPLTLEAAKGKAVVLWFFEEGCPRCRERWPGLLATAKKYEGKPVLFIGINSGSTRAEVQQYAQQVQIPWPIVVDSNRQFEKACDVGEISLQNIYQARLITADGQLTGASSARLEESVEAALQKAAWKVDPQKIPQALQTAWLGVEFGDYSSAGKTIKKSLTSPKADVKQAAEALNAAVQKEIEAGASQAKAALDKGSKWEAYKAYAALTQRFAGFDLPSEVTTSTKTLATDADVKTGLAAVKNLDAAKRLLTATNASSRKRGVAMLERLIADSPDSELIAEAKSVVEQYGK